MQLFTVDVQVMGIRDGRTSRFQIEVANELRVADLKQLVEGPSAVPVAAQRLVYKGKMLGDNLTIGSCGILKNTTVHLAPLMKQTGSALQKQIGEVTAMLSTRWAAGSILAALFCFSVGYNTMDDEIIRKLPSICLFIGFCGFVLQKVGSAKASAHFEKPKDEEEVQVPICPGGG
jgi:hypothetical protein